MEGANHSLLLAVHLWLPMCTRGNMRAHTHTHPHTPPCRYLNAQKKHDRQVQDAEPDEEADAR